MKDSQDTSKAIISSIWGSAVGMMLMAGIFINGESDGKVVVVSIPPIAAAATTAIVLRHSKADRKQFPEQSEKMQLMESRLETLESIVTREEYPLPHQSQGQDR